MVQTTSRRQFNPLKGIWVSITAHVVLILVFTVKTIFFPEEAIEYQSAIRVDIVGLPEKTKTLPEPEAKLEEKPAPPPKVEPKVEKQSDSISIKKKPNSKKAQEEALAKLKAMSALENIEKEIERENQKKAAAVRGNILSQGEALKGIQQTQAASYVQKLTAHIKDKWVLPNYLSTAGLAAQALVQIDQRGIIIKKVLTKSSGNTTYDSLVLNAIDASSPCPEPPSFLVDMVKYRGVNISFP